MLEDDDDYSDYEDDFESDDDEKETKMDVVVVEEEKKDDGEKIKWTGHLDTEATPSISDEELARAKTIFFQNDKDENGSIDRSELQWMLKELPVVLFPPLASLIQHPHSHKQHRLHRTPMWSQTHHSPVPLQR